MKKKWGALVLTLATLVVSAACASSGATSQASPESPFEPGENWTQARPAELPSRPVEAGVSAARPEQTDGEAE